MAPTHGSKDPANQIAETILRARGYRYVVEHNVPATDIARPDEGTQVREVANQAPPANVREYAEQMSAGVKFPAVVCDTQGNLLDGNTRHAAALISGRLLSVIRITDTLGTSATKLLQMSLNNSHGERLTKNETKRTVTDVVLSGEPFDLGTVAVQAAQPKETVRRWVDAAKLQVRARDLSVDLPALNTSQKVAVQRLKADALLEDVLTLVSDARLGVSEISGLVRELNNAKDVDEANDKLADERDRQTARIHEIGTGLKSAVQWTEHLRHLRGLESKFSAEDALTIREGDLLAAKVTLDGLVEKLAAARDIVDQRIADGPTEAAVTVAAESLEN